MKKELINLKNSHRSARTLLKDETPVYKILNHNRASITNVEIVAAIISTNHEAINLDIARNLLQHCNQSLDALGKLTAYEIQSISGLSAGKCAQILAAIELGRRRELDQKLPINSIRSSKDAFDIIYPQLADLNHEQFLVLHLNKGNRVVKTICHSIGGVSGTVVDVKMIVREAINNLASAVILAHNHPSGNLVPSEQDILVTKKLVKATELFEMKVLDHLIIGDRDYYSFADNGLV